MGLRHACVITTTGRLVCWGDGAELGLLDHPVSRVVDAATNRRGTAVTYTSGLSGLVTPGPSAEMGASDFGSLTLLDSPYSATAYLYSGTALAAPSDGTDYLRISLGAEGGCRILPPEFEKPSCVSISWGVLTGEDDESGHHDISWVEQRNVLVVSREVAPGSAGLACAKYRAGPWYCQIAAMDQWTGRSSSTLPRDRQEGTHDFFSGFVQATGDEVTAEPDVVSACVFGHGFCFGHANGSIECRRVVSEFEGRQRNRAPIGRHFEPDPQMALELSGSPVSLACGSTWDSSVIPPPDSTTTIVCAVDEHGTAICDTNTGEPSQVFPDASIADIGTNGRAVCAVDADGKVYCEQRSPAFEPGLLNIPKGLRHE